MPLLTNGFQPGKRGDHFKKHGTKVGARTAIHYEIRADAFLGGILRLPNTLQCIRTNGDVIRYEQVTGEFGILTSSRYIKTYFIRGPATVPDNLLYFQTECAKVFP